MFSGPHLSRGFSLISVVFLILLVAVAVFVYLSLGKEYKIQQDDINAESAVPAAANVDKTEPIASQSETANWKTYQNTKLGFSIKYPSSISPDINSQSDEAILRLAIGFGPVYLTVAESAYSLDEVRRISFSDAKYKVEDVQLAGERALKVVNTASSDSNYRLYVIKNNFAYSFTIAYEDKEAGRIMSTVKFTP